MLCNNIMPPLPRWSFPDPLALSSGAGARLVLAAAWRRCSGLAVAWAMAA